MDSEAGIAQFLPTVTTIHDLDRLYKIIVLMDNIMREKKQALCPFHPSD